MVAAAQDMEVEVVHGLAAVGAGVDDDAVALVEAFVAGDSRRGREKMAQQWGVARLGMRGGLDVFAGDDQEVHRRLRVDIGEGVALLVLEDGLGWDGA